MDSFGETIKRQRKFLSLTLQQAADIIGTTKPHLHDMESGKSSNPTAKIINGIRWAYSLDGDFILDLISNS